MPRSKPNPSDLPVTVVALADLTPYPRNPRHITPAAVNAVAESLAAFGWQQPLVIDPKRVIVAGHTRRQAALQLGWTHAPTVTIPAKHAAAYRLADNRSGEFSTWDLDVLPGELQALPTGQLEALPALDFDAILWKPLDGQTDPDDIPEAPPPRTTRGDVWTLGDHRLMCGDATAEGDVSRLMDGDLAALVSTDPPYLVDYTGKDRPNNSGKDWSNVYREIDIKDADAFFRGAFICAIGACVDNAAWYVWHSHRRAGLIQDIWTSIGILTIQQIIWVKPHAMHTYSFYPWQHEPCVFGWKKGHKPNHDGDHSHKLTSVWQIGLAVDEKRLGKHPTQKPVELFAIPMRKHTERGDVCYEPFSGSGSQIIAGEREGRKVYALEIEPTFVDVAVARWEAFTGRTATR